MNTKTQVLPIIAFLAALGATLVLPVGASFAAAAFTAPGVISLLFSDYGRRIDPLRVPADIIPFDGPGRAAAEVGQAA